MEIYISKREDSKYIVQLNRAHHILTLKDLIELQEHINRALDNATMEMNFQEFYEQTKDAFKDGELW